MRLVSEVRGRSFGLLWAAQGVSQTGTSLSLAAIRLTAAVTLSATPAQMAAVVVAGLLPSFLIKAPAAAWSDSLRDHRRLMIGCNLVQAAAIGLLPLLWWLDALTILSMLSILVLSSLASGVYGSLSSPLLVEVVPKDQLVTANGRLEATRGVADIGGPAIAAMLMAKVAPPVVILADVVSFLASAGLLLGVRAAPRAQPAASQQTRRIQMSHFVGLSRDLWRLSAVRAIVTVAFANGIVTATVVLFMTRDLAMSTFTIGLLLAAGAIGGVLGGSLAGRLRRRHGSGITLAIGSVSTIASLALLPFAVPGLRGVVAIVVFELAGSFGGSILVATVFGSLQAAAPAPTVARVMAVASMYLQVAVVAGASMGGLLASYWGLRNAIGVAAIVLSISLVPQLMRWRAARWRVEFAIPDGVGMRAAAGTGSNRID